MKIVLAAEEEWDQEVAHCICEGEKRNPACYYSKPPEEVAQMKLDFFADRIMTHASH